MLVDDFQVLDDSVLPENEPYARLPRIAFWMDRPLGRGGAGAKLDSELVYFDRDSGTTGARLDLLPRVYWEQFSSWGFISRQPGIVTPRTTWTALVNRATKPRRGARL